MKKRLPAVLCAALLALSLMAPMAGAAWDDGVIFTAVNYTVLPLTADTMPVKVGGTIYVPYTVFDASLNGGIDLGLFSGGQDKSKGTYTIYSRSKNLTFDLNTGDVWDYYQEGTIQDSIPRAIIRNGKVYLPASPVAQYFGLETYQVDTLGYPLIRIKNENQGLEDTTFVSSARTRLLERLNDYYRSQIGQSSETAEPPGPPPSASPEPSQSQEPQGGRSEVRVYLAVRFDTGQAGEAVLDALKAEGRPALLLFSPRQMREQDALIRRGVGEGHAVGLLAPGESLEEAQATLEEGNRLLERIARVRAHTVMVTGESAPAVTQALAEAGWACWRENLSGIPNGRSGAAAAAFILKGLEEKKTLARITLDDSTASAQALPRVLRTIREEGYTFRLALETELS